MVKYFLKNVFLSKNNFRITLAILLVATLSTCGENDEFDLSNSSYDVFTAAPFQSVQIVEREVEAPNVFQVTEVGLWDGRMSLGGVWVAHPDVTEPERVIIRNQTNNTFVIGTLFRLEHSNPDPSLQVSSDAAVTLKILAGLPTHLEVTALRREEFSDKPQAKPTANFETAADIAAAPFPSTSSDAADRVTEAALPVPLPQPTTTPSAPGLERAFIQVGIFSIEKNALGTADRLRSTGIVPTVLKQSSQGHPFWRVIIGPATSKNERFDLLIQIKAQGFEDAYFVTS